MVAERISGSEIEKNTAMKVYRDKLRAEYVSADEIESLQRVGRIAELQVDAKALIAGGVPDTLFDYTKDAITKASNKDDLPLTTLRFSLSHAEIDFSRNGKTFSAVFALEEGKLMTSEFDNNKERYGMLYQYNNTQNEMTLDYNASVQIVKDLNDLLTRVFAAPLSSKKWSIYAANLKPHEP